jgi:hypothetical protein
MCASSLVERRNAPLQRGLVNECSRFRVSSGSRGLPHARSRTSRDRVIENPPGPRARRVAKSTRKHRVLRTPSFFGPLNSGFVPFPSAAPVDALADDAIAAETAVAEVEAAIVARAAAVPQVPALPREPLAPWLPASSARISVVESAVLAAVCGQFALGLLRTLAGL